MNACCAKLRGLKFVVVHNHFRPGGVRRVIELAAPEITRALGPAVSELLLVAGEPPEPSWLNRFVSLVNPVKVGCRCDSSLAYVAEQETSPKVLRKRLRDFLTRVLGEDQGCMVWAHNQGLGRNLVLTHELQRACETGGMPLMLHHHDWWFDNRWQRWGEMRAAGFRTLAEVASVVFCSSPTVRHAAINQADATILQRHLGNAAGWLPNPAEAQPISDRGVRSARRWLHGILGTEAPVWILPCRLLRRKNIAEALLLTRWLRPEAWLVTTGGTSSADEDAYAAALMRAAEVHGWKMRLGVLAGTQAKQPDVNELLAASGAVLLTSLQEGFGLPYLEAAAADRPLIARALPNIMPDLAQFGFRFPQAYDDLMIPRELIDHRAEKKRQERLFAQWRSKLPRRLAACAEPPHFLASQTETVPFSRLTLEAQLELLAIPIEQCWEACLPLNPFLQVWRGLAGRGALRSSHWPRKARQLQPRAYALRWRELLRRKVVSVPGTRPSLGAQIEFMREKLATDNLYPLTWA